MLSTSMGAARGRGAIPIAMAGARRVVLYAVRGRPCTYMPTLFLTSPKHHHFSIISSARMRGATASNSRSKKSRTPRPTPLSPS